MYCENLVNLIPNGPGKYTPGLSKTKLKEFRSFL